MICSLLFCGCGEIASDSTLPEGENVILPEDQITDETQLQDTNEEVIYHFYYDSSDSFHPFKAKTQTQKDLFPLLYDGLIKISPEYTAEPYIADYVNVGKAVCRIGLNKLNFSNGDPITVEDVLYSFELAMSPGSMYADALQNIESVEADHNVIVVRLKTPNRYFAYNLDFPIIQKSTDNGSLPIGRGRYRLVRSGNSYGMVQNEHYGLSKTLPDIELTLLQSNESMLYAVKTGSITAYADPSGEGSSATVGTWTASMSLNHLVFLGLNPENEFMTDAAVRKAILHAIDSNAILTQAYGSQGVITATPINPRLTDTMSYDFSKHDLYNPELSKKLLQQAGYQVSESRVRKNIEGKELAVSILVNKNNSVRYSAAYLISGMLETVGFRVEIERVSLDEYKERIATGEFALYVGETGQRMDASLDVLTTGEASFGLGEGSLLTFAEAAANFLASSSGEAKFFDAVFYEVPMVPLLYRNGLMIYSKSVENKVVLAPHDMFYNIEDWN